MKGQQLKHQVLYKQTRHLVFRCVDKYYLSFCLSVPLSVCPHGRTRFEQFGF